MVEPAVMRKSDEKVQLLTRLGLTVNQATILCALNGLDEPATVNSISKISGVTREKVYCIMPGLQKMGLVEKTLVSPAKYKAVSLKKTASILLKRKEVETTYIKKKAKELFQDVQEKGLGQNIDEETIMVCKKELGYEKRLRAIENAKVSFDQITIGFDLELRWDAILKQYHKLLSRGAKVRLVLQQQLKSKRVREEMSQLLENPLFELRYIKSGPTLMSLYIIDKKLVTIATSTKTYPKDYSVMCGCAPVLVSLTLGYFENIWNNATPNAMT